MDAQQVRAALHAEIGRAYIGSTDVVDLLLTALLAQGHVLLEGVPGVAKTTLAKAFSLALGCSFKRVQFTPDLLPADITGAYILNMRDQAFVLRKGPIFAQVMLGDEINRAPAKTQSALLEAMQENQVTIDGETFQLPSPFLVLATQNPLEQEGVYPLPEAQVDRFLFKLEIGYPSAADEIRMLDACQRPNAHTVNPVLDPTAVLALRAQAAEVHVAPEIRRYVVSLAHFTREHPRVLLGASPRAALGLTRAAKAFAYLKGRDFVLPDDIRALAPAVFSHRLILAPEAELDGLRGADVAQETLRSVRYSGPADR